MKHALHICLLMGMSDRLENKFWKPTQFGFGEKPSAEKNNARRLTKKTWHALLTLLGLISKSCCKSTSSISITRKRLWNSASTRAPCMTSSRVNKPFFSRSMRSKIFWRNLGTNTSINKRITTDETKQHHRHDMDIFAKQTQVQTQWICNNPNMMSQSPGNLITHISVYFLFWAQIPTYTIHKYIYIYRPVYTYIFIVRSFRGSIRLLYGETNINQKPTLGWKITDFSTIRWDLSGRVCQEQEDTL